MRRSLITLFALLACAAAPTAASADVRVHISKSSQTMNVYVNGAHYYSWPVSTGRRGYGTPGGTYRPQRLAKRWYSTKYHGAAMPNSIFFRGGYAIHGTSEVGNLGRPASHGCVRLHPSHAAQLFQLVRSHGPSQTRITIR